MVAIQLNSWYAARTRFGQELIVRDRLLKEGVEFFIPTVPSRGRRKERPAITNLVFLKTTRNRAFELANEGLRVKYISDYMTRTILVVPDKQMEDFQKVMDLSLESGGLIDTPIAHGDRVRVVKGPLKGVEGIVTYLQGNSYVVVGLLSFLYARARVPRSWMELCRRPL